MTHLTIRRIQAAPDNPPWRAQAVTAEAERRAANKAHQKRINGEALADLIAAGLTEDVGKLVITAIASGRVRHLAMGY